MKDIFKYNKGVIIVGAVMIFGLFAISFNSFFKGTQPMWNTSYGGGAKGQAILWEEPQVEQLVRTALGKPSGDITENDLDEIQEVVIYGGQLIAINWGNVIDIEGSVVTEDADEIDYDYDKKAYVIGNTEYPIGEIETIKDFQHFKNLLTLGVYHNNLWDISSLEKMPQLKAVCLESNYIEDISGVKNLTNAEYISLASNLVEDITPLSGLKDLRYLDLSFNFITDVRPLATLMGLEELYLAYNEIEDISPLAKLPNLEKAWVEKNHITDFTAVEDVLVEADN